MLMNEQSTSHACPLMSKYYNIDDELVIGNTPELQIVLSSFGQLVSVIIRFRVQFGVNLHE